MGLLTKVMALCAYTRHRFPISDCTQGGAAGCGVQDFSQSDGGINAGGRQGALQLLYGEMQMQGMSHCVIRGGSLGAEPGWVAPLWGGGAGRQPPKGTMG